MKISLFLLTNVFFIALLASPKVAAEKSITVVCSEWKGYTNRDGTGIYWDMVKAIYEPLGFEVHTQIVPWKRAVLMLELKQADALVGDYYYAEKQGKERLYPNWHLSVEDPIIAIFRKDRHEIDGFNSLNDKTIIWMRGYNFDKIYLSNIRHQSREVSSEADGLNLIKLDRYDVFLDYRSNIETASKKAGINLSLFETTVMKVGNKLYLSFSNTDKSRKLIQIYDRRIPELLENGELKKIFTKNNSNLIKFGPDRYSSSKR